MILPLLAIATCLTGATAFKHAPATASAPITPTPIIAPTAPEATVADIVEPLSSLIGQAESDNVGGYDAANNGRAMDLGNDGVLKVFDRPAAEVSVGEILLAQSQRRIHAVGRFQIIGITLQEVVDYRCIDGRDLFTKEVQDRALVCLLQHKRPRIWQYIKSGSDITAAANAVAREWASMPAPWGGSYYPGGDRAHATRAQVFKALEAVHRNHQASPEVLP